MNLESLVRRVKARKAGRVFIQAPEGLKASVLGLAGSLEKKGVKAFICMEPCFGACDLREREARAVGADLILHLGHSDMGMKSRIPVMYEEWRLDPDPVPVLRREINKLKGYERIGLVATLQFLGSLKRARGFLKRQGKKIMVGSPSRARYPGQVLGCDYSAAKPLEKLVDCFLFMGSGRFHPLGLGLEVEKPVLFLDLEKGRLEDLDQGVQKLKMARASRREWARGCQRFGILVSSKPGQLHLKTAERVRDRLGKQGKEAFILVFDEIGPEKLMGLKLDCLVNCACPRLTEDTEAFGKIILGPGDL